MRSHNDKLLGFVYGDKAKMYQDQNQVDSMLHYNLLAYSNLKKAGDKRNCTVSLLVIGYSHYLEKGYKTALVYYNLALKECPAKDSLLISSIHRQQCLAYYCLKEYHKALHFARLSTLSSDMYDYSKAIDLAMIFNKLNQLDSADFYLRKCTNPHEMAQEYYQTRINICAKQKKWDAVIYYTGKLVTAKDSLYKHSLSESFAGLEKRYNYESMGSQNKSLIIKNQQNHIIILFLLFALSVGGIVFSFLRNKQDKKMLEQQRLLTNKEKELALHAQERATALQKQIHAQQNTLKTLNKLKNEMTESSKGKFCNHKNSNYSLDETDQATIDQIVKHVVENVDLLYNNISKRLAASFPNLLENEILICCFLLAGFDNVTIYITLHLQPSSYNVKRTNLRKKLNLHHEADLTDFLAKF
jgi:oligoribonuclease (3'-5' exoribonuclease)